MAGSGMVSISAEQFCDRNSASHPSRANLYTDNNDSGVKEYRSAVCLFVEVPHDKIHPMFLEKIIPMRERTLWPQEKDGKLSAELYFSCRTSLPIPRPNSNANMNHRFQELTLHDVKRRLPVFLRTVRYRIRILSLQTQRIVNRDTEVDEWLCGSTTLG